MTVRAGDGVVFLEGDCPVEDAEPLLAALLGAPGSVLDLSGCAGMHSAVFQVLLALRPRTRGKPPDGFLQRWVVPLLASANKDGGSAE